MTEKRIWSGVPKVSWSCVGVYGGGWREKKTCKPLKCFRASRWVMINFQHKVGGRWSIFGRKLVGDDQEAFTVAIQVNISKGRRKLALRRRSLEQSK